SRARSGKPDCRVFFPDRLNTLARCLLEHVQLPNLRSHLQPIAGWRGTDQLDHERLLLATGQVPVHEGFRAQWLDQIDQQVEPRAGLQMLWPDADDQLAGIRTLPPPHPHPLPLTAGQLPRLALQKPPQPEQTGRLVYTLTYVVAAETADA